MGERGRKRSKVEIYNEMPFFKLETKSAKDRKYRISYEKMHLIKEKLYIYWPSTKNHSDANVWIVS